ncbi:MAG TPA: response regulator, partial [Thermomicrobiales bacterium]|nr:response regulator [Thermomicrobiales bacterium]
GATAADHDPEAMEPDRPRQPSTLERPHVVIVSDDPDLQSFLGEGLVYAGLWTSGIASAIQTLEVFRLRTFDLALIDAALGGFGPLELIRRLRRAPRAAEAEREAIDIPIVVIAAGPAEIDAAAAVAAGANEVIFAPIDLDVLAARLFAVSRSWRAVHPDRPWADEAAQRRSDSP